MLEHPPLPPELTIYAVGEWRSRCLDWLLPAEDAGVALMVDASAVQEADAAGVQLLIALANSLLLRRRQLVLVRPSDTLVHVCGRLGADFLLADTVCPETAR